MASKQTVHLLLSFVSVCFLAISLQVLFFSPISPDILELPPASSAFPPNNKLQGVIKLGEGFLDGPEDIAVDKECSVIYTATRDSWLKRLHKNGSWETWKRLEGHTLLGITTSEESGVLVVCDTEKGLLKVGEDGVSVLTSQVNGYQINFADDVIEASDGCLYFSVASTKFGLHNWYLDFLEAKPHGQLLKYDPSTKQTSILLDDLGFANGVALSEDQDYLVICETWKFRCLKYWLRGEKEGETEIFVENLPGGPDNINLAPDGSFWIALLQVTTEGFEFIHASKVIKKFIATFPKLIHIVSNGVNKKATIVNVAADGKITKHFDDSEGKVIRFVTTAIEFEDHLYLGSLNTNFIGKFPLKAA
ncbi:hypothetical protein TIFTF001_022118 [Ficus carica]|uniref:Strictosidine synthase conserved region domain-containing protein n=1 Tax=Ficus carica TaxID=3494 RepID=A0AA88DJX7_FICCA|nr:hypothetical protein TIFTF001_022118 [Ficus carica]